MKKKKEYNIYEDLYKKARKEQDWLLKRCSELRREDMSEILNHLQDDLEMDKTGESGYKTHKESYNAII